MIVFLIPVRHHNSVPDYEKTWSLLNQSLMSLTQQTNVQWHAVVCANKVLSVNKEIAYGQVTFLEYESDYVGRTLQGWNQREFNQHLIDKAQKRRFGLQFVRSEPSIHPDWYFMMDADDLVSKHLVANIYQTSQREHRILNVTQGLIVDANRQRFATTEDFNRMCGTSVAVRPRFIQEHFENETNLTLLLAQHHFHQYHRGMCSARYWRHTLSAPLAAYMQHDDNHGRNLWSHRKFDGQEISEKVREEFLIPD